MSARADDPGLLTPAETSLLTDQYELAMAASYFKRGMNAPAVFELFARHLPPHRHWLLAAGIGPALELVKRMRFGERELSYLAQLGFAEPFLSYLEGFRFTGDVDAVPEGTVAFAGEPLARVTGPRIEAQLLGDAAAQPGQLPDRDRNQGGAGGAGHPRPKQVFRTYRDKGCPHGCASPAGAEPEPYPVAYSERLAALAAVMRRESSATVSSGWASTSGK